MDRDVISLIKKYLAGEISEADRSELMKWVDKKEGNKLFFEKFCSERSFYQRWKKWEEIDPEKAFRKFNERTAKTGKKLQFGRWQKYAAVVILVISLGSLFILFRSKQPVAKPVIAERAEITPGCSKAVLVFANGRQIELNSQDSLSFRLGENGNVISKGERLVYEQRVAESLEYNELKIPRGGEYQLVLSDGTVVHLNSASSLKYPVAFGKERREVTLSGEAYFEVTKSRVPFYVRTGDMTVKVYGTSFNINNHIENRIQTALVEGKIGITVKGKEEEYILAPSQLADFDIRHGSVEITETDLTPYLAWTKGLFVFTNQTLRQIMTSLSLWYDMDVFYQNPSLQDLHFTGCVKRYDSIDNILRALSQTVGVTFRQQGKTLIISN